MYWRINIIKYDEILMTTKDKFYTLKEAEEYKNKLEVQFAFGEDVSMVIQGFYE